MKDEAEMKSKLAYVVERESIVWVEINVTEVEVFIIVDACPLRRHNFRVLVYGSLSNYYTLV